VKSLIVSLLAAGALTLGACATTQSQSAALSPEQMKVELASIAQQLDDIDAGRYLPLDGERRAVFQGRLIAKLEQLVGRREDLRLQLAAAGYPRTADEVRDRIAEIDRTLAKRGQSLAPSSFQGFASTRPVWSLSSYALAYTPTAIPISTYPTMSAVPGSNGPRSSDWRRTYRLKEERAVLYAKLQTLEYPEN
jgi:hypothetical protein